MQLLESLESGERRRGSDFEKLQSGSARRRRHRSLSTRSMTKAQRGEKEEAAEPLPLDKLAPEVLNIIAEALAADEDLLVPKGHLNCLARSCN